MEATTERFENLGGSSRRLARRLLSIGEDRLELFLLELVEEREHFVRSLVVALGIFAFGLLAMMSLTAAIVIGLGAISPTLALGVTTVLYGAIALGLSVFLKRSMGQAEPFSGTLDQLRKDRDTLEEELS